MLVSPGIDVSRNRVADSVNVRETGSSSVTLLFSNCKPRLLPTTSSYENWLDLRVLEAYGWKKNVEEQVHTLVKPLGPMLIQHF